MSVEGSLRNAAIASLLWLPNLTLSANAFCHKMGRGPSHIYSPVSSFLTVILIVGSQAFANLRT